MTAECAAEAVHQIDGWDPPHWASNHQLEEGALTWLRSFSTSDLECIDGSDGNLIINLAPELQRWDKMRVDLDAGSLMLSVGPTLIYAGDDWN
jgi:hypothetical protein